MDLKLEIKNKARLIQGMMNLLKDDIQCIRIDADTTDLFNIIDSVYSTRETINKMSIELYELEMLVHDFKQQESKRLQTRKKQYLL